MENATASRSDGFFFVWRRQVATEASDGSIPLWLESEVFPAICDTEFVTSITFINF